MSNCPPSDYWEMVSIIKPCPFCGDKNPRERANRGRYGWYAFVHCNVCGASGGSVKKQVQDDEDLAFWNDDFGVLNARYKWNKRASDSSCDGKEVSDAESSD